jgi:uncharacterized protein YprB with RNaseH-like and TPR domain
VTESLRDRLRRLRKDEPGPSDVARASPGLPSWFVSRLDARRAVAHGDADATVPPDPELRIAGELPGLVEESNAAGAFASRTTRWPADHAHGARTLREALCVERDTLRFLCGDERLLELDPSGAVFLDIETTGLSGGAGTKAFLVGLGRFDGDAFELWQGFLRGPEEERAMLAACAERIRGARGVVSFFGKHFDRHRLEDKMRIHGVPPPFDGRPHLDLYHPFRRLYRAALPDAKLQTFERFVGGFERERDLPGSFAPAAWFDYLAGRPHLLDDVFRHNRDDVLSLVTLCAELGSALDEAAPSGGLDTGAIRREASRCAALAGLHARDKRWNDCAKWSARAQAIEPSAERARELLELAADALRRCDRLEEAREAWTRLAESARDEIAARAWFELARSAPHPELSRTAYERAASLAEANAGTRAMSTLLARARRALTSGTRASRRGS